MRKRYLAMVSLFIPICGTPICFAQSKSQVPANSQEAAQTLQKRAPLADESHPQPRERNPRYQVQSGDILEISFRYTPEFDQEVAVQPDGFIQLKGISNDVKIQGQTVPEVIETLKQAYVNVLNDPAISVVLREFEKPYFIAGGQVGHPGKYDLRGDTTATQAIAIAGGFVDYAKNTQVVLFRRYSNDQVEVKMLNLRDILKGKNASEDVFLRAGDMLYVPKTFMAKIDRFLPRSSIGTYFSPAML